MPSLDYARDDNAGKVFIVIDSHCHLADKAFDADRDAVIARAHAAGVTTMICIADTLEEGKRCVEIAGQHEGVFATVGVHPHVSSQWTASSGQRLEELLRSSPKTVAVGEVGLDYHYMRSTIDEQQAAFREQLALAKSMELPVIVHCREAVEDVWRIVDDVRPDQLVLHCCTEAWADVARFVERGYLLSFTGIATYANAQTVRDTIAQCPLEHMMIETDAPYLTPEALRAEGGRSMRNEPAYVVEVARGIAAVTGKDIDDIAAITSRNAVEFFRLSP
ncbi:MAG: TatD DNase family protein [Candidatus Peregrinibacteria bacterium Gr01-1014_25]|nr:MAG: TatD DNase family protein [Candidatus Peregrinibacteria bacterium Gr01-1014_25]